MERIFDRRNNTGRFDVRYKEGRFDEKKKGDLMYGIKIKI